MKIFVDDKRDFSEVQLYGYNCNVIKLSKI